MEAEKLCKQICHACLFIRFIILWNNIVDNFKISDSKGVLYLSEFLSLYNCSDKA